MLFTSRVDIRFSALYLGYFLIALSFLIQNKFLPVVLCFRLKDSLSLSNKNKCKCNCKCDVGTCYVAIQVYSLLQIQ
jgi:hypothetical protein